jgi:5-exo-hydroxycamphor dehydrogenase
MTTKNLTIAGATFPKPKHYFQAMHLAARMQKERPLADLISHRFAIEEADKALESVRSGAATKAIIDPERAASQP